MRRFWIGLDCGGTRTRGVLADDTLQVRARAEGGPGNPLSAGMPAAARAYRTTVRRLLRSSGVPADRVRGVGLGAAGAGRPEEQRRIRAVLERLLPGAGVRVDTDGMIALLGATRGAPGIVVIAGTGSFVLGIDRGGARVRGGGWGPLLGDEGSGAALGRAAIGSVLRAEDGRGPRTTLRGRVLEHFGATDVGDLVGRIYRDPPPAAEFARLWPALVEEARGGDAAARSILRRGGADLAETVEAVARRLDFGRGRFPLIVSGGVLSGDSLLRRTLVRRLARSLPRARLRTAAAPPEIGALYLARGAPETPVTAA
jgi:N-acetylglucosamine kinase-like BadF-type ATPase